MDKAQNSNPPPLLFLVLSVLNLSVNAGALWWPGLHCTAFQSFWVECKSTSILTQEATRHLTPAYRVPYMQRAQEQRGCSFC